jgi:glutamate 5-kinase
LSLLIPISKTKKIQIVKNLETDQTVDDLKKDLRQINIKGVNEYGSGGMQTKIEAAKTCQLSGCNMVIANGLYLHPISKIIEKNNCTWFKSKVSKLHARKKWIISSIAPKGAIIIDDGAKKALRSGKSLLAAGIKKITGKFDKGDHIKILDKKNNECARGLSSFTSEEIIKIMGHQM